MGPPPAPTQLVGAVHGPGWLGFSGPVYVPEAARFGRVDWPVRPLFWYPVACATYWNTSKVRELLVFTQGNRFVRRTGKRLVAVLTSEVSEAPVVLDSGEPSNDTCH